MTYFSFNEIIFSILCAIIYGVGIGSLFQVARLIPQGLYALAKLPYLSIIYSGKIGQITTYKSAEGKGNKWTLGVSVFLKTVIFSIGLVLLSYMALDGEVRVFVILFSLLGFLLSYTVGFLLNKLIKLLSFIYKYVVIFMRVILYPLHFILYRIYSTSFKLFLSIELHIPRINGARGGDKNE